MEEALTLFKSMRGSYICGQTMYLGILKMMEVEPRLREKSNIADAYLMQSLFFPFQEVEEAEEAYQQKIADEEPEEEDGPFMGHLGR